MHNRFHRSQIDLIVNDLLEPFFELSREDAIAALAVLINPIELPMMNQEERNYPPLPKIFQKPAYQKIQSQLQSLSEIMYNRQPQDSAIEHNPSPSPHLQLPETKLGIFGLRTSIGEKNVTAEDVHQYMRFKFALAACAVATLEPVTSIISENNKNLYYQYLYYSYLAQWVRQVSGELIPEGMKAIIKEAAAQVLQTARTEESLAPLLPTVLTDKSLAPFQPYIKMSPSTEMETLSVNSEEIINYLCSLSPAAFNPDMAACLEALFSGKFGCDILLMTVDDEKSINKFILDNARRNETPIVIQTPEGFIVYGDSKGDGIIWKFNKIISDAALLNSLDFPKEASNGTTKLIKRSDKKFTKSIIDALKEKHAKLISNLTSISYHLAQEKLQDQINNGNGKFSHLEAVCLDFMTVAKAHKALISYGDIIRSHDDALVKKVDAICQEYVTHLQTTNADKQEPLLEEDAATLKQFLSQADEFANEKKISEWISNFFAAYFTSELEDKDGLLKKILNLSLSQDKLFIVNDQWLEKISLKNINIQDDNAEITLTPYHINRILLHALTTPIEKWSHLYHAMFDQVLTLLNDTNNPVFTTQALKRDSYPIELREQLNWLNRLYNGEVGNQPKQVFPMLHYPKNAKDFCRILNYLSAEQINVVFNSFIDNNFLSNLIKSIDDLKELKKALPPEKWENFVDSLDNTILSKLTQVTYNLNNLKEVLPKEKWNNFEDSLDNSFLSGSIKNVNDLNKLKEELSQGKWNKFANSLDNTFLRNLTKSINDLNTFKMTLPQEKWNSFSDSLNDEFIKKLVSHINNTANDFHHFDTIFTHKIHSSSTYIPQVFDLLNIFPKEKSRIIVNSLNENALEDSIRNISDLISFQKIMSTERWNSFVDSFLGFKNEYKKSTFVKKIIHTVDDLFDFRNLFIQGILPADRWYDFSNFRGKSYTTTQKAALAYFFINLVHDDSDLKRLLEIYPIENVDGLGKLFENIDEKYQDRCIELLGGNNFLKSLIKETSDLSRPIYILHEKWRNFLNSLDNEFLINLIKNRVNLFHLKLYLPSEKIASFVGSFSFLRDEKSIRDGINECLSLDHETPEIQKNILFCILKIYKSELNARENEYNPTLLGFSMPIDFEWGVARPDKLAAVEDLFAVLLKTKSLEDVYKTNQKALDDGTLAKIYTALKIVLERELGFNKVHISKI